MKVRKSWDLTALGVPCSADVLWYTKLWKNFYKSDVLISKFNNLTNYIQLTLSKNKFPHRHRPIFMFKDLSLNLRSFLKIFLDLVFLEHFLNIILYYIILLHISQF